MDEAQIIGWVVKALVVLVGLYFTICKPMLDNQKVMTELSCAMKELTSKLTSLESDNTNSHRRLWEHSDKQDEILSNHETRISVLEKKGE